MNNENKLESSCFVPSKHSVSLLKEKLYLLTKRMFDFFFALVAGVVLLIPMLIIAILVRMDSPGPVIYKQERLGLNGKKFTIYKFRSMAENAEENGPQWAHKDDTRCTRIGKYLRLTRLDELPQLFNILNGDMSFVGPRPERECFYEEFEKYIPNFRSRLAIQPGLTGWAQINGGYDLGPEEKLKYDLEYIEKRTILFDVACIIKTVRLVFTHEGAR